MTTKNILVTDYNPARLEQLKGLIEAQFPGYTVYPIISNPPDQGDVDVAKLKEVGVRKYAMMIGHIGGNPTGAQFLSVFKEHNPRGRVLLYTKRDSINLDEYSELKRANNIIRRSENEAVVFDKTVQLIREIKSLLEEPGGISYVKATDILFVAALNEELSFLFAMPFRWSEARLEEDGNSYRACKVKGAKGTTEIVAVSAGEMGLTAAAIVAAKALVTYRPRIAIMLGICGGRKEKGVAIGDIVVADQAFHYQYGAYKDGEISRQLRSEPVEPEVYKAAQHLADDRKTLHAIQASAPKGFLVPDRVLKCHVGPVASADLVVKDESKSAEAWELDRKTVAIDMETYAFMRAARLAKVRWFTSVKSVTDFADAEKGKDDNFRDYAKFTSVHFAVRLAKYISGMAGE